jgi:hypothetical protein
LDPATLAAAAITAALPYVVALGKEAAKEAAGEAGKSVWQWVKGKLTSAAGQEAVKDLENAPDDADNRKAAEAALSKLLKADAGALSELKQTSRKSRCHFDHADRQRRRQREHRRPSLGVR